MIVWSLVRFKWLVSLAVIVLAEKLVCFRSVDNVMVQRVKMGLVRPMEKDITQGDRFNDFH